ncbi:metallophosphoesterase family protein [Calidithermus timidus]|jgi:predicted phosphodiesterase|uniref:metallophosphoesterase family protein n=1 Tax=Calidithermus timidus TaxID=307124 RepID=UPI00035D0928|nr:metallophosphoesterase family protein [Calidithermus timidus]
MRIGILSDIHANLPALAAALSWLSKQQLDHIIAVGDIVGYGPHPKLVIRMLQRFGVQCIGGGTDLRVAFQLLSGAPRNSISDMTLRWTIQRLEEPELGFLKSLPYHHRIPLSRGQLVAFHGTPEDPEVKIDPGLPAADLLPLFERFEAACVVASGNHLPFERRLGERLLIDPGSVGLSLGGAPGADAAVLVDTPQGMSLRFEKLPYDTEWVAQDMALLGFPPPLIEAVRYGSFNPSGNSVSNATIEWVPSVRTRVE